MAAGEARVEAAFDEAVTQGGLELLRAVRAGLPRAVVDAAVETGRLSAAELDRVAGPRKTMAHRRGMGRLSPEQSRKDRRNAATGS